MSRGRVPGYPVVKVSTPPGTGNSVAAGLGFHRNARLLGAARVVRRRSARARVRSHAGKWPGERSLRQPPYQRVAAKRSPGGSSSAAGQGSGPGMSWMRLSRLFFVRLYGCLQATQYNVRCCKFPQTHALATISGQGTVFFQTLMVNLVAVA